MAPRTEWTIRDVPDQSGRSFVVTGANSGIGLEAAKVLADRGGHVVMACRNLAKAETALNNIMSTVPDGHIELRQLDLASMASIRDFADWMRESDRPVDVLINNAGVMAVPRTLTEDGFESQFGINHLGHFALTGLLLDRLLDADNPRVVNVSSLAHSSGRMDFEDLMGAKRYNQFGAYSQSKLANLLFTMELQRRFRRVGIEHATSVACHPGFAATNLADAVSGGFYWEQFSRVAKLVGPKLGQSSADGALPTLRAATDREAKGGDYFGPAKLMETRGPAVKVKARPKAFDVHDARALWEKSIELTGVDYAQLVPAN